MPCPSKFRLISNRRYGSGEGKRRGRRGWRRFCGWFGRRGWGVGRGSSATSWGDAEDFADFVGLKPFATGIIGVASGDEVDDLLQRIVEVAPLFFQHLNHCHWRHGVLGCRFGWKSHCFSLCFIFDVPLGTMKKLRIIWRMPIQLSWPIYGHEDIVAFGHPKLRKSDVM